MNKYAEHQLEKDLSTLQDEIKEAKEIENEQEKIFTLFELRGKVKLLMKMVRTTFFTKPRLKLINSIFDDIEKLIGKDNLKIYRGEGGDKKEEASAELTLEDIEKMTYKQLQEKIKELDIKEIDLNSKAEILKAKLKEFLNIKDDESSDV